MRFAVAIAMAPPEPPSPTITAISARRDQAASVERAMASACPRSSAPMPGIGAGGVDQRHNRNIELVGELHQTNRLPVAFRPRHAEVMFERPLGGWALFVPDHEDLSRNAEAANDGFVLGEIAVAGERHEVFDQRADEIEATRALRVARDQRLLPWRQLGVEIAKLLRCFGLEPGDLVGDVGGAGRRPASRAIPRPWPQARPPAFRNRDNCAFEENVAFGNSNWIRQTGL